MITSCMRGAFLGCEVEGYIPSAPAHPWRWFVRFSSVRPRHVKLILIGTKRCVRFPGWLDQWCGSAPVAPSTILARRLPGCRFCHDVGPPRLLVCRSPDTSCVRLGRFWISSRVALTRWYLVAATILL